jgi:hypothetical protein
MANDLEQLILQYVEDLRVNRCGGDSYDWHLMRSIADYLEILVMRSKPKGPGPKLQCLRCGTVDAFRLATEDNKPSFDGTSYGDAFQPDEPLTTEDVQELREELWTHPIQKGS